MLIGNAVGLVRLVVVAQPVITEAHIINVKNRIDNFFIFSFVTITTLLVVSSGLLVITHSKPTCVPF